MTKVGKKKPFDTGGPKKVLVFCVHKSVGKQIVQQLEKRNVRTWLVEDEKRWPRALADFDPELILIEINAPMTRAIEGLVSDVFAWMRGRARSINKALNSPSQYLWEHSKVLLFKSESEITSAISLTAEMADTDEIVRKCLLVGDVKYIGLYSSLSFLSQIRMFLE